MDALLGSWPGRPAGQAGHGARSLRSSRKKPFSSANEIVPSKPAKLPSWP
jgi:hypothetical protein